MSEPCPACGARLRPDGRFCKACGWDADLDESEEAHLDGVDLPEAMDDDAYADALAGAGLAPPRRSAWGWVLWGTAGLLAVVLAWLAARRVL